MLFLCTFHALILEHDEVFAHTGWYDGASRHEVVVNGFAEKALLQIVGDCQARFFHGPVVVYIFLGGLRAHAFDARVG